MQWFYLALLSVVAAAVANVLRKVLLKDKQTDPVATIIVYQLMGAAAVFLFVLPHGFVLPPITTYPGNFLLQASFAAFANLLLFKALKYIEASEATILVSLASVVTIFSAVFLLGEQFSPGQTIGAVLILAAVFVIAAQKKKAVVFNRGVVYVLGAAILYGLSSTNDAFLVKHSDPLSYLVVGWLSPGIFLLLVQPHAARKMRYFANIPRFMKMLLLVLASVFASVWFFLALGRGAQISQLSPISQSTLIVTVFLAAVFLKERDYLWRKLIAGIVVMVGVALLVN